MHVGESFISPRSESRDPSTGRTLVQITAGDCFDYPLYYYVPTVTGDGREIIFFRYEADQVQHYKIEAETGLTTKLTDASTANCLWRPYLYARQAMGVRDLMSAFSPAGGELVYLDGNRVRALRVDSLADRVVHELPGDRIPCATTGVSTDGAWFCFAHADREQWWTCLADGAARTGLRGVRLDAIRLESGERRTLLEVDHWITHCFFYDRTRILFGHAAHEHAILMTDLQGGYYTHLRTMRDGLQTCHYQATDRGVVYEVVTHGQRETGLIGRCDPDTMRRAEYQTSRPVYHIGHDREGRLWFDSDGRISYFPTLKPGVLNAPVDLTGPLRTYSEGQRSHLHAAVTPNRRHILFTGGDPANETNHLFLLDIADVGETEVVPQAPCSADGGPLAR